MKMEKSSVLKQSIALFFFINIALFSYAEKHQVVTEESSPAPQPQPPTSSLPKHGTTEGSLRPEECGPRCSGRCSNTQYKKPCLLFCNKCCAKCLCVPPGTYGNKHFCPCYDAWKTKRGGPKCP